MTFKILINSMNYAPEAIGVAKYSTELAEWLADHGHDVHVVCSNPYYPHWSVFGSYNAWWYSSETINNVKVNRVPIWVPGKPTGIKRMLHLFTYSISSFPIIVRNIFTKPDIIISVEPAFSSVPSVLLLGKITKAKTWLHIQDFELDAALSLGLLRLSVFRLVLLKLEKYLLLKFNKISTLSDKMIKHLHSKIGDVKNVYRMPNWVDTEILKPIDKDEHYLEKLGIDKNKFVALYSGNIGRKQGLDILIEAAENPQLSSKIHFLISGDGAEYGRLRMRSEKLTNISWIPLQDSKKLNLLLNSADVHLLPQLKQAEDLVMPSKLGGMLASGKPIIATASKESEIYNIVHNCGICVEPGDANAFVHALNSLMNHPESVEEFGMAARKYVLENFMKKDVLGRFENELYTLLT